MNQAANFKGKKILLVEDNPISQEIAREILQERGFLIDVAEDGCVALDKMKAAGSDTYDLILMDIEMPHMDGYEATKHIRALDDIVKSKIPIIAITVNDLEADRQHALDAGMDGYMAKPVNAPTLLQLLAQVL